MNSDDIYGPGDLMVCLDDMQAAFEAMESWVDAFEHEEPEKALRVRRSMAFFEKLLFYYDRPPVQRPKLRLVKPGEEDESK